MDLPSLAEFLQRMAPRLLRRWATAGLLMAAAWLLSGLAPLMARAAPAAQAAAPTRPVVAPALADDGAQLASQQIRQLEQQMQAALTQARVQQEQMAIVSQRLAAAESSNGWLPWLLVALAAMALLTLGLAWRLRQQHIESAVDIDWPMAAPTAVTAIQRSERPSEAAALPAPAVEAAWPRSREAILAARTTAQGGVDEAAQALDAPTRPKPRLHELALATGVPLRPVSVEELLDLEQQVDFFLALGQQQSALDLLLGHVRESGGASALPYLKLLDIYCEQGNDDAYQRTRERFNRRFNAVVPPDPADLASGLTLEDYPVALQRMQRSWTMPQRAAAEVQLLLLRQDGVEPFELPAYRDLLLLQALLLDLPQAPLVGQPDATSLAEAEAEAEAATAAAAAAADSQPAALADAVDLLLPLGEGPTEITSPRPHLSQRTSAQAMLAEWVFSRSSSPLAQRDRPIAARQFSEQEASTGFNPAMPAMLDLDLNDYAPAPRDFTEPAAFTDNDMRRDSRLPESGAQDGSDTLPSRR